MLHAAIVNCTHHLVMSRLAKVAVDCKAVTIYMAHSVHVLILVVVVVVM